MAPQLDDTFLRLVEPHRAALRLHCYRMLGSTHDSEDVLQETLVRAWRARHSLGDPSRLRPWLYRIATNVCLRKLRDRPRRPLPSDVIDASDPHDGIKPGSPEAAWLEPYPDVLLSRVDGEPDAAYELKESVTLAFLAVLQMLSPLQRATLLLRDVLGFTADETAEALAMSVSAANSALFRARAAVQAGASAKVDRDVEKTLLAAYVRAFESGDIEAFVTLLRQDVKTTMPPSPTWIAGLRANGVFYREMFKVQAPDAVRLVELGANLQPALAFYRRSAPGDIRKLRAIQVVSVVGGKIERMDHFMAPRVLALFALPEEFPAASQGFNA